MIDNMFTIINSMSIAFLFIIFTFRKQIVAAFHKRGSLQIVGVILTFLVTVAIAVFLIYYVGNYLVHFVTFQPLQILIQFAIVIVVLGFCTYFFRSIVAKISKEV